MNTEDFKRIITSFADNQADIDIHKGRILTEIRGELIEAKLTLEGDTIYVIENEVKETAFNFIKNRIACLHLLADRILDYVPKQKNFVHPRGLLLDELEFNPTEDEVNVDNSTEQIISILGRKVPYTSNVVYLTSDAGEGKTTLINTLSRIQAKNYKEKKADWLILPIPLGGRPFLRFDDIIIASIVNNLRFRYFYYESFIELVKLGLIVPAFDGFEEMFMQSSPGEALSATGNLMNKLNSSGSVLIAARKAYFDYKNFSSQAKLFDTINSSVSFARLSIKRWDENQFIEFAKLKGFKTPKELYKKVLQRILRADHPIITRPVLVNQLLDVIKTSENEDDLISQLDSTNDYFPNFVHVIIEREANNKWIDTSGEPYKPLIPIEKHYELLSNISEEMWLNDTDSLNENMLDLVSEIFSEHNELTVNNSRQIKERIKQHALIIRKDPNKKLYSFDHEEFKDFFLGVVIGQKILSKDLIDVKNLLRKAVLPQQTSESLISKILDSENFKILEIKNFIDELKKGEGTTSFVRENSGNIIMRIINGVKVDALKIEDYEIPANSFVTIKLENISFENCHFQTTSLYASKLKNCYFKDCSFDRLEINDSTIFEDVTLENCSVESIFDLERDKSFYNPESITKYLIGKKITVNHLDDQSELEQIEIFEDEEDLQLTERALRKFMRSSHINDSIFKLRLGNKADKFLKDILPVLLDKGILEEVDYLGQGQKRRFKLAVPFSKIDIALNNCQGIYQKFLDQF